MSDVCIVGSFMMDLIARTPRFPKPGETITGSSFTMTPGGKGFNQAIAAARAGVSVAMVGCLGYDAYGEEFRAWLEREGVDASGVSTDDEVGTGVGLPVVNDEGENCIIIIPRSNLELHSQQVEQQSEIIRRARVVVMQLEVPEDANQAAADIAHKAGGTVILNPAPFRDIPVELLEHVDLLLPNESELTQLAESIGISTDCSIDEVAQAVHAKMDLDLIVTLGEEGALVVDDKGTQTVPSLKVKAVNTVGAGDTFTGNLAALLAQGVPLREAAARANVAAACSVTRVGSADSAPRHDELDTWVASLTADAQ